MPLLAEPDRSPSRVQPPAKVVAASFYKELLANGYRERDVIAVATELIALLTEGLRGDAPR